MSKNISNGYCQDISIAGFRDSSPLSFKLCVKYKIFIIVISLQHKNMETMKWAFNLIRVFLWQYSMLKIKFSNHIEICICMHFILNIPLKLWICAYCLMLTKRSNSLFIIFMFNIILFLTFVHVKRKIAMIFFYNQTNVNIKMCALNFNEMNYVILFKHSPMEYCACVTV